MLNKTRISHSHKNKKRTGNHHLKHKSYLRTYAPYLPLTLIVSLSVLLGSWQPIVAKRGTLAYATNVGNSGLLDATNKQRESARKSKLTLNQLLSSAATSKANDMVSKNYWAHITPEGFEPWVFIDKTGYQYTKAGENLAYGFLTSNDTISGWMNSPTHKENMLDGDFSEVGFGFANSSSYNQAGNQTIVVAMYGQPQTLATTAQASATDSTTPEVQSSAKEPKPITTSQSVVSSAPVSKNVSRIQALTQGKAPWALAAVAFISGLAMATLLIKHSLGLRHLLRDSEKFILHHPLLDVTLVSLALLGLSLSLKVGVIL